MLSTTSRYALRAMLVLAAEPADRLVPGKEMSRLAQIPGNYLSKIMITIAGAGLVEATRGSNGGYRLRRPANQIHLIEVVGLFDREIDPKSCFLGVKSECSDCDPCTAHMAWKSVKTELVHFFEATTLDKISGVPFKMPPSSKSKSR
jgi:Rrf2 family iron-sulfur cluster assembly transcriptional regulator